MTRYHDNTNAVYDAMTSLLGICAIACHLSLGCAFIFALIYGICVLLCYDQEKHRFVRPDVVDVALSTFFISIVAFIAAGVLSQTRWEGTPFWLCEVLAISIGSVVILSVTACFVLAYFIARLFGKILDPLFAQSDAEMEKANQKAAEKAASEKAASEKVATEESNDTGYVKVDESAKTK